MIKLEVMKPKPKGMRDQCLVVMDEPARVEIDVDENGHLMIHVYRGTEFDMEQEPLGAYDSDYENTDWEA